MGKKPLELVPPLKGLEPGLHPGREGQMRALAASFGAHFRALILPTLPVRQVSRLFTTTGRLPLSPTTMTGLLVLQEMGELSAGETLDRLRCNMETHFALGIEDPDDSNAYCTLSDYVRFRSRLRESGLGAVIVEAAYGALAEHPAALAALATPGGGGNRARSIARIMTKAEGIKASIREFLKELERSFPGARDTIATEFSFRYVTPEPLSALYAKAEPQGILSILKRLVQDYRELIARFKRDPDISGLDSYRALTSTLPRRDWNTLLKGETLDPARDAACLPGAMTFSKFRTLFLPSLQDDGKASDTSEMASGASGKASGASGESARAVEISSADCKPRPLF
ncbi:MAG: transposase [Deltaproteobacteria bacterium]|jgi:hypothetical protein|nr:transposase [Deltaproteobacteria bacterium]